MFSRKNKKSNFFEQFSYLEVCLYVSCLITSEQVQNVCKYIPSKGQSKSILAVDLCVAQFSKTLTFHSNLVFFYYEPQRKKTYLLTRAHNEDSNQPAHPRSLIRIVIVHMMKLYILGDPECAQRRF